jgi:GT2 family glycosyltransferase
MLKLSIIIVNYNTKAFLEELFKSICDNKYDFGIEIIVVDNNSQDGSIDMLYKHYPEIQLIKNDINMGFARAVNAGIKLSRGEYTLLLNPDTTIMDDALHKLVSFLDEHEEAAVVTGRVVYPDMTDQGVARMFPTPMNVFFGRKSLLTRLFPGNKYSNRYLASRRHQSDKPFEVDWVSGACLMARKNILEQVGLLDEQFFMYWEDADLCYRIKQKGWRIYCVPGAIVVHHEGKSSEAKSFRLIVQFNRSIYHYYRKHYVQNYFELKNLLAIIGLTLRAVVIIIANFCKVTVKIRTNRRFQ